MNDLTVPHDRGRRRLAIIGIATVLGLLMGVLIVALALAGTNLSNAGYLDFSYGTAVVDNPTGEKPESKLWWNDGFWWGVLYNDTAGEYHIYRLIWGTQTWEDTGVPVDDREDTKSDALWDGTAGKLYIVSHNYTESASWNNNDLNYGRLYRYSYDETTRTYTKDINPYVTVNQHETETLVLEKDSTGRLWVTFVSRPQGISDYLVYANTSDDDGLHWGNSFILPLPIPPTAVTVDKDDISSVVSFVDSGVPKIGIMWSNQLAGTLDFATHTDGDPRESNWTHNLAPAPGGPDDHISLKSLQSTSAGIFAAIKLATTATGTDPLIGLVAYDTIADAFSFHTYSTVADNDTRPILIIDEDANKAYIFVTGKPGGSKICYKSLDIAPPLSTMGDFAPGNCGTAFIEDLTYTYIDNATSMKGNVNSTTGIVVLASDDYVPLPPDPSREVNKVYVHNTLGTPPPVLLDRGPAPGSTDVPVSAVVTATFSLEMDEDTFSGNITVDDGSGPAAGSFSYHGPSRMMTFTSTDPLLANDTYTVTLSSLVKSATGNGLYGAPEQWSFSTISPTVTFSDTSQVALEDAGTITITVDLSLPSALAVMVPFTVTGTAEQGVGKDYTITPSPLVIPAGSSSGDIVVTVNDDSMQEGSETVIATMGTPTNATQGGIIAHTATIVDNDTAGITVSPITGLVTTEGGVTDTFTVVLDSQPAADVSIDLSSSDTTEGTVSPVSLTFTPANWNTPQTVTVTGVDDAVIDGDVAYTIVTAPASSSSDPNYSGLNAADVSATNNDNDDPGITVSPITGLVTTEGGVTDTFTVVLDIQPAADVSIGLSSSDTTEGTVSPVSLTFTLANWNTPQTVTVTGVDDSVVDGDVAYTIVTAPASSSDPDYNGLNAADVSATNNDNDDPGITVSPITGLVTTEGGGTDTFTVVLDIQPAADVSIGLSSSDTTEGTVSPVSLTFTPANWNTPQTVTVTGVDDSVVDGDVAYTIVTAPASSSDPNYNGLNAADLSVTNNDNDTVVYMPLIMNNK